jgi:hypothetical protein
MSQALYRKWRPQQWEQVVGQEHVVQTLRNALAAGRIAHAYLFAGPRGTGKTTTARLLAKAATVWQMSRPSAPAIAASTASPLNQGRFLDLIEIDAASNTSVEDVRSLRDKINFSPNSGRYKVYIIDEVHMLSTAAFNALLKTLEEPPAHAIFILATTEVHKIPATVLSRCQRHEFRRIPVNIIVKLLSELAGSEACRFSQMLSPDRPPVHGQPAGCHLPARPAGFHGSDRHLERPPGAGHGCQPVGLELVDALLSKETQPKGWTYPRRSGRRQRAAPVRAADRGLPEECAAGVDEERRRGGRFSGDARRHGGPFAEIQPSRADVRHPGLQPRGYRSAPVIPAGPAPGAGFDRLYGRQISAGVAGSP